MNDEQPSIRWHRSLVFQVPLCASSMLVLATIVMTAGAYYVARDAIRDGIHQRLRVAVVDRQRMISAYVTQQRERAALVASRTRLRSLIEKYLSEDVTADVMRNGTRPILTDARRSSDGFVDIWICDSNGKAITATHDKYVGHDFSNTLAFQQGRQRQYLDDPQLVDDKHRAYLSAPATANDGELLGVVMILLDTTPLLDVITDRTGLGETGEVLVATQDESHIRYFAPRRHDGRLRDNASEAAAMDIAIGGASNLLGETTSYGGKDVLLVHLPIEVNEEGRNWGLVAKLDTSEAYLPIRQMAFRLGAIATVLAVTFAGVSCWMAIRATQPLWTLTRSALAISAGQLNTRAAVNAHDECGVLARTFNGMLDRLANANEALERQVEDRTNRLQAILDTAADAIITIDESGNILSANDAAEAIFGYEVHALVGQNVNMLMPSPHREQHAGYLHRYLTTGDSRVIGTTTEVLAQHKDGTKVPVELLISEGRGADGRFFTGIVRDIAERKEAEEALFESEQRYQEVAAHVEDVLWMTSADGAEIIYVSPAYESVWGRTCQSLYEHAGDWLEGIHPDDRGRVETAFREQAAGGDYDETYRVVRPDGSLRWVHATGRPVCNAAGEVYRIAGVARDVTEFKEANEKLRRFKNTLDQTGDCVFMFHPDTLRFFYCNDGATKQVGYSLQELMQMTPLDIKTAFDEVQFREMVEPLIDGHENSLTFETTHRHKDGHDIPVEVNLQFMSDTHDARFVAVVRDISERRKADQAIRESEERFQQIANHLEDLIWMTSGDGREIIYLSPAYEAVLGGDIEKARHDPRDWAKRIHPEDRERILRQLYELSPQVLCKETYRIVDADGSIRWVEGTGFPIRNKKGEVYRLAGTVRDVTAVVESKKELETAKKHAEKASFAKSEFLAGMSHELRTPLNGVIGMTELLAGTDLDSKQRQFVEACRSSGESLLSLINDVLDFSKIEAGKLQLDLHDFDLEKLVTDTVTTMSWRAAEKGLETPCYVDQVSRTMLKGDSTRLRQILVNLVGNAIKFTETGEITVRTKTVEREGEQIRVRFSVSDTGIGISSDKLDRLFQSFSQVDASTTRNYGGTGLGLAISQSLVELMGGTIGVESLEGVGSTFWFEVPFAVASESSESVSEASPLAGKRTLIVDDNETNRLILTEFTAEWGAASGAAASVDEALAAVDQAKSDGSPFHIVLTDYNMPQRDGLELARALKDDPQLIVLLLGSTDIQIEPEELSEHGIAAALRKPVRRHELYDVLCGLFDEGQKEPASADPTVAVQPALSASHILVSEDNRINQLYVVELMKQLGCTCDTVANGREAIEAVQQGKYDLVLMDCQMPEMDGFEATRRIRQLESDGRLAGHLPIVALTANAVKGDRERCLDAGMDDYLAKPVEKQQVISVLRQLLNKGQECSTEADKSVASIDPAKGPSEEAPPIDAESFLARCFGNVEFAESLLSELESTGLERVEDIRQTAAKQNAEATADAAHALKGAAGILCAESVQELAAKIEQAGRSAEIEDIAVELDDLAAEMQRCLNYVPQLRQELNTVKGADDGCASG